MPSRSATCIEDCNRGYALCPHYLPHVLMIEVGLSKGTLSVRELSINTSFLMAMKFSGA